MSWMTRSTSWERTVARASAGDEAPRTRAPCRDSRTWKAVLTASLSSATSTVRCARRSSTFEVTEVIRKTPSAALGLQAIEIFAREVDQTVRVAMAGETFAALSDGCQAAI